MDRTAGSLRFPPWRRMRSPRDFARVYSQGKKSADRNLVLFVAPGEKDHTRIGLSISRKHGNSVVRHRLRRLLREAYRLQQHEIPEGLDLILIPGREARSVGVDDLRRSLQELTRRALRP